MCLIYISFSNIYYHDQFHVYNSIRHAIKAVAPQHPIGSLQQIKGMIKDESAVVFAFRIHFVAYLLFLKGRQLDPGQYELEEHE